MAQAVEKSGGLQLKQQVTYLVTRLNAKLTAQATRILRDTSELSLSQWRLMAVLDSHGPGSMAEFTRFTDFDKGQTSRVTADLLKRGYLAAAQSAHNRRVQILSITPEGRAAFDRAAVNMKRRRQHLSDALTPQEHATFEALMNKLAASADEFEILK